MTERALALLNSGCCSGQGNPPTWWKRNRNRASHAETLYLANLHACQVNAGLILCGTGSLGVRRLHVIE
jgi:hypothetical protein